MAETPREPDRYDAGHDLWKRLQDQGTSNQIGILIAALRQAADEALERAAQAFAEAPTTQHSGAAVASVLRYLTRESVPRPAAAPAAVLTDAERDAFYAGLPLPAPAAETGKPQAWANAIEYCEEMFSPEWLADRRNRSIFAAHIFRLLDAARAAKAKGEGT